MMRTNDDPQSSDESAVAALKFFKAIGAIFLLVASAAIVSVIIWLGIQWALYERIPKLSIFFALIAGALVASLFWKRKG